MGCGEEKLFSKSFLPRGKSKNRKDSKMNENELKSVEAEELTDQQKFLEALKTVKKGYTVALISTSVIALGAMICAVHYKASLGALLLILSVVNYLAIVINLLYSRLGIAYRSFHGGMKITALYGKHREVVYIPDKVIMLTVTEIGNRAFTHKSSEDIREIHLPKTLLKIGTSAFAHLPSLTDVYYEGSEEEWARISALAPLENVTLHFGEPIPRLPKKEKKPKKNKKNKELDQQNDENTSEKVYIES